MYSVKRAVYFSGRCAFWVNAVWKGITTGKDDGDKLGDPGHHLGTDSHNDEKPVE